MRIRCKNILFFLLIITSLAACVEQDHKDRNCDKGLTITFFSQSQCQNELVYPTEINDIRLFVFDRNNILRYHEQIGEIQSLEDYSVSINTESGLYTVSAWAGIDDSYFDISELEIGSTTKKDILLRLKRTGGNFISIEGKTVYYGEGEPVYVGDDNAETVYEKTSINMLEVTNRINVSVHSLPSEISEYEIIIESNNGSMNLNGSIATDETLQYQGIEIPTPGVLEADFTTLKLETGYENTLVVRRTTDDTELYRGSLLGTLILKNPNVNLNCDHDFTISFTTEDQCNCGTYTITEIWVNNWLVHSYGTDF